MDSAGTPCGRALRKGTRCRPAWLVPHFADLARLSFLEQEPSLVQPVCWRSGSLGGGLGVPPGRWVIFSIEGTQVPSRAWYAQDVTLWPRIHCLAVQMRGEEVPRP